MTDAATPIDWTGQKQISLALQGGGSHGAFTWGVLDAILEDKRLDIEAVTGTSAGAMNAVVLAEGYLTGGREGARKALARFWRSISDQGAFSPAQRKLINLFFKDFDLRRNIAYWWTDFLTHYSSPYEFNPLNINPLRDHIVEMIDFDKVRAMTQMKIFVSATNVHNGRITVFEGKDLTADHVMASACLPFLFQAVEIDGAPYWDGGYMGNPALFPLFYKTGCSDILIVQINPIERLETPKTARDIQDRLNEITFNGALMGEMRAMDFVNRLLEKGKLSRDDYMQTRAHRIDGGDLLASFAASTKVDASWPMIQKLHAFGRDSTKKWLAENFDKIGVEGTLNLRMAYK
ncbi:patatin-like phospholipase family protein [Methylocella silvestris]|uniref:Patatin n=1 Tax=Methylocella silvestris TaxID=199596 RepID=A0A2J7TFN0_METSI|nr:patatin-like phospholipase family protein [Methylocella silvestris]PNG25571.1 patatin [Methylocella silvestris]